MNLLSRNPGSAPGHIQFEIKAQEEKIQNQRSANQLTTFFVVDEGREEQSTTIPTSARDRNAIKWRFDGVSMMAHHECWLRSCDFSGDPDRTCIARKPYIFVIFRGGCPDLYFCDFPGGGGVRTHCPPLWIHTWNGQWLQSHGGLDILKYAALYYC